MPQIYNYKYEHFVHKIYSAIKDILPVLIKQLQENTLFYLGWSCSYNILLYGPIGHGGM